MPLRISGLVRSALRTAVRETRPPSSARGARVSRLRERVSQRGREREQPHSAARQGERRVVGATEEAEEPPAFVAASESQIAPASWDREPERQALWRAPLPHGEDEERDHLLTARLLTADSSTTSAT